MKTRIFSTGRKIAIAICMALAVATGGMSVADPHMKQAYAEAETPRANEGPYDSISITNCTLDTIEAGLDIYNGKPYALESLKKYLEVDVDNYEVYSINYLPNTDKAYISVRAKATETAPSQQDGYVYSDSEANITVSGTAAVTSVTAEIDETRVSSVGGVYKVIIDGKASLASAFITDLSVCRVDTFKNYLKVSITTNSKLGTFAAQADDYVITQSSFTAGSHAIEVGVAYDENEMKYGNTKPVVFENPQIVDIAISAKDGTQNYGTLYSYTNIADVIQVNLTYNYLDKATELPYVKENVSDREYEIVGTLVPTKEELSTVFTNGYTVKRGTIDGPVHQAIGGNGRVCSETERAETSVPGIYSNGDYDENKQEVRKTYSKPITIRCGEKTLNRPFTVTMVNPVQLVSINSAGFAEQHINSLLDLSGVVLNINYYTGYQDQHTTFGGPEITKMYNTAPTSIVNVSLDLNDYKNSVEVHYDTYGADEWKAHDAAPVPKNATQALLRFTYGGQMFYSATTPTGSSYGGFTTHWKDNTNQITSTAFKFKPEDAQPSETTVEYFAAPAIDESIESYRPNIYRTFSNADFMHEKSDTYKNGIASGMQIVLGKLDKNGNALFKLDQDGNAMLDGEGNKILDTLTYTFNFNASGILEIPEIAQDASAFGAAIVRQGDRIALQILKPAIYTVKCVLPTVSQEDKDKGVKDKFWLTTGTVETAPSRIQITLGQLSALYTGAQLTSEGEIVAIKGGYLQYPYGKPGRASHRARRHARFWYERCARRSECISQQN